MEIRKTRPGRLWVVGAPDCIEPMTVDDLAAVLQVSRQTVLRWARGAPIPRTAELAIRTAVLGVLEHRRWRGWRVDVDGRLWAPNGYGFMPGELEAWQHVFNTNRVLWRRIGELTGDAGADVAEPRQLSPSPPGRPARTENPSSDGRSSSDPSA